VALSLFLRAPLAATVDSSELDLCSEDLRVLRSVVAQSVRRSLEAELRGKLLEDVLRVAEDRARRLLLDRLAQVLEHEALRSHGPVGDIHRADHRFEAVGEQRGLLAPAGVLLAATEEERLAEPDIARHHRERRARDDGRLDAGEVALSQIWERAERWAVTTRPSTASPRNSSRSFGSSPGGLCAVRAVDDGEAQEVGIDPYAEPLRESVR